MVSVVAARYAKALADVVEFGVAKSSQGTPEQIVGQLKMVQSIVDSSADLRGVMASPAVPPSKKRGVMARLMGPLGVSQQVRNFMFVVIDHRRAHELKSIIEAFEALTDERLGFVRADVTSAQELSAQQRAALEAQLSRLSGKRARPQFTIDPALIGGVVAKVGSTVYDGSVRGQLDKLRSKLGS